MTDDDLRKIAELYNEINNTAGVKKFLRNCASFGIFSGAQKCILPNGLQYRIKALVDNYYKELKESQKNI